MDADLKRTLKRQWPVVGTAVVALAALFTALVTGAESVEKAIRLVRAGLAWVGINLSPPAAATVAHAVVLLVLLGSVAVLSRALGRVVVAVRREQITARTPGAEIPHDNVLWRDSGETSPVTGDGIVIGPGCPDCKFLLLYMDVAEIRVPNESDVVSSFRQLMCSECRRTFMLGPQQKRVGQSRAEVARFLRGRRVLS